jgi:hypothetical protein
VDAPRSRRRHRRRLGVLALAVALAALVIGGCSDDDGTDAAKADGTTTTVDLQSFGPAPTLADTGDHGPGQFVLPSKNIGCVVQADYVRCDIANHTWLPAAEQPADCELDWGSGLELEADAPQFVCAGDTVMGSEDVLAYGQSSQRGDFRCESSRDGITCQNLATKHGFLISRALYTIF